MTQTYSPESVQTNARTPALRVNFIAGLLMFLLMAIAACVALYAQGPPRALPADAPTAEFASGRAMRHLEVLTRAPRPIGSAEHAAARDYILRELTSLGLETEVQSATVLNERFGSTARAATVQNVIARLRGTGNSKPVILASHYDSVANSPGASDDGSGVVALLETARALKSGPAPKNDIVFLFTDGEESGLFGAKAFADEHPLAKGAGVVLNFEARGSGGPAIMFETSEGNGQLIAGLAASAPHPTANSLGYEIYRLLPNDTDLSVFKRAQMPGMNFAYIDGVMRYHTRADNIENMDERSVQHQGSYALALARHFGNLDLSNIKSGNAIYFDLFGLTLLRYPASLVLPLTILAIVLFVVVTLLGVRRGAMSLKGLLFGFVMFVVSLVAVALSVALVWFLVGTVQRSFGRNLQDDFYRGEFYLLSFAALGVAVFAALYNFFSRRSSIASLGMGALLCWLILLVAVSLFVPGASYMLLWPLLFSLGGLAFVFLTGGREVGTTKDAIILSLCALPGIILLVPMIHQVFVALGLGMSWVMAALVAILLGLLVPHILLLARSRRWLLPGLAVAVGLVCLLLAAFTGNFDRQHPKFSNVFYALNTDTGKAVWGSADAAPDEWTNQFFSGAVGRGPLGEYVPGGSNNFLNAPAPAASLRAPDVRVLDDRTENGVRKLHLKITPSRKGDTVIAQVDKPAEVLAVVVNGKRAERGNAPAQGGDNLPWLLQYMGAPEEGVDAVLEVRAQQPLKISVFERSYGLPEAPGAQVRPRPDHIIPSPSHLSDATIVSKAYTF